MVHDLLLPKPFYDRLLVCHGGRREEEDRRWEIGGGESEEEGGRREIGGGR